MPKAFVVDKVAHVSDSKREEGGCFCGEKFSPKEVDKVISRAVYIDDFLAFLRTENKDSPSY